jgi:hypothetical protein
VRKRVAEDDAMQIEEAKGARVEQYTEVMWLLPLSAVDMERYEDELARHANPEARPTTARVVDPPCV